MEIKQLKYFLCATESGSFNKAAEKLYTSQPNISKNISALEKELGHLLFERTSKGLKLTPYGKKVYIHAQDIVKNSDILSMLDSQPENETLYISSYPSNMIACLLADIYIEKNINIFHKEGNIEEITDQVSEAITEIGILFIAKKQIDLFKHTISHKKLCFHRLDTKELCLFVGPNNNMYKKNSVHYSELRGLKFISTPHDFFSIDHHLEHISMGLIPTHDFVNVVRTNSDHLNITMLLNTDLCSFSIDLLHSKYETYNIKKIKIEGIDPLLELGYIHRENQNLSSSATEFIFKFSNML